MNLYLTAMTKELARDYYSRFEMDPMLFADPAQFQPFVYSDAASDARVERYAAMGRVFLAAMLDGQVIGEVVLKDICSDRKCCTLGISLVSDQWKGRGYGTAIERSVLRYAFDEMGMDTVYADSLIRNERSRHVLQKVGFREIRCDGAFCFYECKKATWQPETR